jgi:radical SAM superfamily enzyme YgiQ (UPF0313 family)
MADIVLINPRFETSYWGLEHALKFFGKRANLPVACLPLLAALTPAEHRVTLIDENVEPIDFDRCARADIVGVTGMIVQRQRMRAILVELKRRGCFVVVGGPWVTVQPDYFGALADVVFVGEAEESWPRFLGEWQAGRHAVRYEQAEKTDMSTVPVPRFDLLKMRHYAASSLQFSRGCPFACEFCDIIVVFGRRPRIKQPEQVIAELEALLALGADSVFIVDDNLIGNKKAIRPVLETVCRWQEQRGYPVIFFTEASIDLADDPELMALMVRANIQAVFIGIETPNEAALRETRKLQNLRRGGTILDKVRRIQNAGMEVWSGMIVGFDSDTPEIFEQQRRFLAESGIVNAMAGMLTAIPRTPLYDRLLREGRLDTGDIQPLGTNVLPLQIDREALRDGYLQLMHDLYAPDRYFARLDDLYLGGRLSRENGMTRYFASHRWAHAAELGRRSLETAILFWRLTRGVRDGTLRREYRRQMWKAVRKFRNPIPIRVYAIKCAVHYHITQLIRQMSERGAVINTF